MKHFSQFAVFVVLCTGCRPDPQDVPFLAIGEEAIVGSYTLDSLNADKKLVCTLDVLTNHTFAVSNLPVPGSSRAVSITGAWSMAVYHVFDARRYRVSFTGVTNIVRVGFPNADLPEGTKPTALSVWWVDQQGQPSDYLFRQIQKSAASPQPR